MLSMVCCNALLNYVFMYFSVLSVIALVFLSCNVNLKVVLTFPYQREVLLTIKLPDHFFSKCPIPSQENGSCFQIDRLYGVCYCGSSVFLFFPCFPFIVDVFTSDLVCDHVFFLAFSISDYWTVVIYCCLYFIQYQKI